MKQKITKLTNVILFCVLLILSGCTNEEAVRDESVMAKELQISEAKSWFADYKAREVFHPIFTDINYHWKNASITILEDGSKAVTVPITDLNLNPEYKGQKVLYLYPFEESYDTVVYELNPDSNQTSKAEDFQKLESYNGYISTWDLKKGFIKAQKFANSNATEAVAFKVVSEKDIKLLKLYPKAIELETVTIEGSRGGGGIDLPYSYITYLLGGSISVGGSNTDNYFNPPHGGGGSTGSTKPPTVDDTGKDPCEKIKELLNNLKFKSKLKALQGKTTLNKESGFSENKDGIFTDLIANGSDAVTLPRNFNTKGYTHVHVDPYEKTNANGDLVPVEPIKMFSPEDISKFLLLVHDTQINSIPVEDIYGVMVSSTGNYQLKFTGNVANVAAKYATIKWGEKLDDIYKRYLRKDAESGFLKFLKDKIGIDGIELYKMEADGISLKTLDETGKIKTINCNQKEL